MLGRECGASASRVLQPPEVIPVGLSDPIAPRLTALADAARVASGHRKSTEVAVTKHAGKVMQGRKALVVLRGNRALNKRAQQAEPLVLAPVVDGANSGDVSSTRSGAVHLAFPVGLLLSVAGPRCFGE